MTTIVVVLAVAAGAFVLIAHWLHDVVIDTWLRFQAHRRWRKMIRRRPIQIPRRLSRPQSRPDAIHDDFLPAIVSSVQFCGGSGYRVHVIESGRTMSVCPTCGSATCEGTHMLNDFKTVSQPRPRLQLRVLNGERHDG
jgi:hypothetical protein